MRGVTDEALWYISVVATVCFCYLCTMVAVCFILWLEFGGGVV